MVPKPITVPVDIGRIREHADCCDSCWSMRDEWDSMIRRLGEWAIYVDDLQREIDRLRGNPE